MFFSSMNLRSLWQPTTIINSPQKSFTVWAGAVRRFFESSPAAEVAR